MTRRIALTVFSTLALGCCTVGPDYHPPELAVPDAFVAPTGDGSISPDGPWWQSFGDPELVSLVDRAVRSNTDLRIAVARLREARAELTGTAARTLPTIDVAGSYTNSQFSENGFLKGLGDVNGSAPGAIFPGQQIDLHEVSLDASWELDIFGGVRRAEEAASAEVTAAVHDVHAVLVSLLGELAGGYFDLRGLQQRLAIAKRTRDYQQATVEVIQEQVTAGVADELDLARAQTQLANASARVPALESDVHATMRRIETLLGVMPGTLDAELAPAEPLPPMPDALAVGIPSETLRRRPDVQAAERRLAAATARIGQATADLFPRFSLTGQVGLQSQRLDALASGNSLFWLVGPTVRWPLLDFGRIRANIDVQNARTDEALARYEGTVLQALSDVEIALVRLARDRRKLEELTKARDSSQRAVRLAEERYRSGVLEFLDLLDTQRTFDVAAEDEARGEQSVAADVVALFKALGGGWAAAEHAPVGDQDAVRVTAEHDAVGGGPQ